MTSVFVPLEANVFFYMGTGLLIFTKNELISYCVCWKLSSIVSLHVSQRFDITSLLIQPSRTSLPIFIVNWWVGFYIGRKLF